MQVEVRFVAYAESASSQKPLDDICDDFVYFDYLMY